MLESMTDQADDRQVENPNADTIAGLREAADWLEQHPELQPMWHGYLLFRNQFDTSLAREQLECFAAALGDRAVEELRGRDVEIRGAFGPVKIAAAASVQALGVQPPPAPAPEYEPILKPQAEPDHDNWSARRENGS